jgi:hypothetical protein
MANNSRKHLYISYLDHPILSEAGCDSVLPFVDSCGESKHVVVDLRERLNIRRQRTVFLLYLDNRGVEQGH